MCESKLIIDKKTTKPIEVPVMVEKFKFFIEFKGNKYELLSDFDLPGIINYAALHSLDDKFGVKKGYMFVVGEQ